MENDKFRGILPPASTRRWVIRRKAQVVVGVKNGVISLQDACTRYGISEEEFRGWERAIEKHGLNGLKATRVQDFRDKSATRKAKNMSEQMYRKQLISTYAAETTSQES